MARAVQTGNKKAGSRIVDPGAGPFCQRRLGRFRLEIELRGELNLPRAAGACRRAGRGQSAEPETAAAAADQARQVGDRAGCVEGGAVVEVLPLGVVPDVVKLKPELQESLLTLAKRDLLEDGHIPVVQSGAAERPNHRIHSRAALERGLEAGSIDERSQGPAARGKVRVTGQDRPRGPAFREIEAHRQRQEYDFFAGQCFLKRRA